MSADRTAALIDAARTVADIDATILYWRTRGTLAPDIARDLRQDGMRVTRDTWPYVREAMIARQTLRLLAAEPQRAA